LRWRRLTRLKYNEMPAGLKMDALVAEKVMGWKWDDRDECFYNEKGESRITFFHPFSTDITAVWEVVEKMSFIPMGGFVLTENRGGWTAHWPGVDVFAPTVPLAICRAALMAMEEK
jgi:hypothetical protein